MTSSAASSPPTAPPFSPSSSSKSATGCPSWVSLKPRSILRGKAGCACTSSHANLSNYGSSSYHDQSHAADNLGMNSVPADDSGVLIECRDVHKSFGEKHILRGVSFKIRPGEAVGIIGPSGTGKSTILKIIAGLLAPDKGDIYIRGKKRSGLLDDYDDEISGLRIGLMFQSGALFDSLTVRENVGFLLYENSKMPESEILKLVTETLATVGLKGVEDRLPSELSGGMKKRVALARSIIFDNAKDSIEPEGVEDRLPSELSGGMKKRVALARSIIFDNAKDSIEPEVLMYDEPTAGLDPIASTVVEDLIRSIHWRSDGMVGEPRGIASFIVVTHQHSTIRRAVDRLIFVSEGKVVWEGTTRELESSENAIVRQFATGRPIRY
ncbi:hypothetical protein MLD38_020684 [Melastoma candidum]|uniref:Uncharacterized protein n=1 Tax=Melastoma candidum TaxID=119954 RepID=A0ACB9QFL7_9MYRT|nr:hypothetical protein MLD38_020684 [Melastoma candidum]